MKRIMSDEDLKRLMQTIVDDAAADQSTIDEVAGSPTVWWAVHRQIAEQKKAGRSPWPPPVSIRRWLMFGLPVAASILIVGSYIAFRPAEFRVDPGFAALPSAVIQPQAENIALNAPEVKPVSVAIPETEVRLKSPRQSRNVREYKVTKFRDMRPNSTSRPVYAADEIKTDFIALSYATSPDSGQLVRVKVPSSMMVTLGLVSSVEKPSSLVDAEVVVGDDGQTHAIRFIRQ